MKGIIIAGGLGTRLRPLTYHRPKPLVPVVNRPFLEYQVALLRQHGIDDIVFATNYMAEKIEGHFGDGSRFGVRMRYAIEDKPLGTGGAIRNAADVFPGETVAVFNGDVMTDFDLSAIANFHRAKNVLATIALTPIPTPHPFGTLLLDSDGRVLEWREPTEEHKRIVAKGGADSIDAAGGTDLINAGFYIFDPEFLERIAPGIPASVERDIFPPLLASRAAVYGIAPGGFWMDVGRAEQLCIATQATLSGAVATSLPSIKIGDGTIVADDAQVDDLTAIGADCRIGKGALLERCILMNGATVGENVHLRGVVVDEDVTIEDDVTILARDEKKTTPVIAAHSVLAKGTRLQF